MTSLRLSPLNGTLMPIALEKAGDVYKNDGPSIRVTSVGLNLTEHLQVGDQIVPADMKDSADRHKHMRTIVKVVSDDELWIHKPFAKEHRGIASKFYRARAMNTADQLTGNVLYLGGTAERALSKANSDINTLPQLPEHSQYLVFDAASLKHCVGGERIWLNILRPEMSFDEDYSKNRIFTEGRWYAHAFNLAHWISEDICIVTEEIYSPDAGAYYGRKEKAQTINFFRFPEDLEPSRKNVLSNKFISLDQESDDYFRVVDVHFTAYAQRIPRAHLMAEDAKYGIGGVSLTTKTGDFFTGVGTNDTIRVFNDPYLWTNSQSAKATIDRVCNKGYLHIKAPLSDNSKFDTAVTICELSYPRTQLMNEETIVDGPGSITIHASQGAQDLSITGSATYFVASFFEAKVEGRARIIIRKGPQTDKELIFEIDRQDGKQSDTQARLYAPLPCSTDLVDIDYQVQTYGKPFTLFNQSWDEGKYWGLKDKNNGLQIQPAGLRVLEI